jgi:WD40 repeat protein
LIGHEGAVNSVSFSPDGLKIISGSNNKMIRIWNLETGLTERKYSDFERVLS